MFIRCEAADGCAAAAVVKILVPLGAVTPACDVHGAALLAVTRGGRVHPLEGAHEDYATAVWYRAQSLKG